jgi:hypothetical protein
VRTSAEDLASMALQHASAIVAWCCMLAACTSASSDGSSGSETNTEGMQTSNPVSEQQGRSGTAGAAGTSDLKIAGAGVAGSGGMNAGASGGGAVTAGNGGAGVGGAAGSADAGSAAPPVAGAGGGAGSGAAAGSGGTCSAPAQPSAVVCGAECTSCLAPEHGQAACDGAACSVVCDSGYHECGGRCASDTALASCGSRCEPCPTSPNGSAMCSAGACQLTCNAGSLYCVEDNTCPRLDRGWNDDSDRDSWRLRADPQNGGGAPSVTTRRFTEGTGSIGVPITVPEQGSISFGVWYCETPFDLRGKKISVDVYFEGSSVNASVGLRATILTRDRRRVDAYLNGGPGVGGGGQEDPQANMWFTLRSNDSTQVAEWLEYIESIEIQAVFGSSWSGTVYFDNLRVR